MIADGMLQLNRAPNENTFSDWINDERLTLVLREFLRISAIPFREREVGAIIFGRHSTISHFVGDFTLGADFDS